MLIVYVFGLWEGAFTVGCEYQQALTSNNREGKKTKSTRSLLDVTRIKTWYDLKQRVTWHKSVA